MDIKQQPEKLSLDEFQSLVRQLPELRGGMGELQNLLAKSGSITIDKFLDKDSVWSDLYELPFEEFLGFYLIALGKLTDLLESARSPDPSREFLRRVDAWDLNADLDLPEGVEEKHIITLTYALQRHILSIMLYHRPLSKLVAEAAQGKTESLFLAVRVDRSIVACPPIALRIAKAEMMDDKRFFLHLRSALKGPSGKHWEAYKDLRYAFVLLREIGFNALSDAQLEHLFVDQLGLYPKVPGARKNLRKQLTFSKKISTTSK